MTGHTETHGDGAERQGLAPRNRRGSGIVRRLFIGYGIIGGFVFVVSLVSLVSLTRLNRTNERILEVDVPIVEAARLMIDAVLDQEVYARRSVLHEGGEMMDLFRERRGEFGNQIERVRGLPGADWVPVDELLSLHGAYNDGFLAAFESLRGTEASWDEGHDAAIRELQQALIAKIEAVSLQARQNQRDKAALMAKLGAGAFHVIVALCVAAALLSVVSATMLARSISLPLTKLKVATERISEGKYDEVPDIRSRDEVGALSDAFSEMAVRLKRLEEMSLDAHPLTRLPGSSAIEKVLSRRLEAGGDIAFCLVDLDNFKAFSDRYGYARGSELIKALASIVESSVKEKGSAEDFVGHIGGDDIVVITVPGRYQAICEAITSDFDAAARGFYDAEDRRRGYIRSKTRQGQERNFPIITVSIAVVTNEEQALENPMKVGERAAEIKEYAKTLEGSVYVVERRKRGVAGESKNVVPFPHQP